LGEHPATGKPVRILAGRYGPYIKHEDTNANVPKGADLQALTLEQAIALLDARAAQGGGKKKPARRAAKASEAKAPGAKPKTSAAKAKKPATKARKAAAKAKAPARKKAS
jgi:DNA topoisomerase-1